MSFNGNQPDYDTDRIKESLDQIREDLNLLRNNENANSFPNNPYEGQFAVRNDVENNALYIYLNSSWEKLWSKDKGFLQEAINSVFDDTNMNFTADNTQSALESLTSADIGFDNTSTQIPSTTSQGAISDLNTNIADRISDVFTDGVLQGGAVTENTTADLNVLVEPLTGFNTNGARINLASQKTVDLSSYLPTTTGNEKYVSVYVDVIDLETNTEINIAEGTPAAAGNATKPDIDNAQGILLADVLLAEGQTTIVNDDIEEFRKQKIHLNNIAGQMNYVNVKDFGAKGDGVTDDTDAIQNALNSNNYKIFIPEGVYMVDPLDVSENTTIVGEGEIKLKPQNLDTLGKHAVIEFVGGSESDRVENIHIEGIKINGNKDAHTGTKTMFMEGINSDWAENCSIKNCHIVNIICDGIDTDGAVRNIYAFNKFDNCGGFGIHITDNGQGYYAYENSILSNKVINCGFDFGRGGIDQNPQCYDNIYIGNICKDNERNFIIEGKGAIFEGNQSLGNPLYDDVLTGVKSDVKSYSPKTFYIDEVNGSDTNDGLTESSAFASWERCKKEIPFNIQHNYEINIIGNLNEDIFLSNVSTYGHNSLVIQGNTTTTANHEVGKIEIRGCAGGGSWGIKAQYLTATGEVTTHGSTGIGFNNINFRNSGDNGFRNVQSLVQIDSCDFGTDVCAQLVEIEGGQTAINFSKGSATNYAFEINFGSLQITNSSDTFSATNGIYNIADKDAGSVDITDDFTSGYSSTNRIVKSSDGTVYGFRVLNSGELGVYTV